MKTQRTYGQAGRTFRMHARERGTPRRSSL